jgi:hypothetical protein
MLHRTIIDAIQVTVVAGIMLAGATADGAMADGVTVDGGWGMGAPSLAMKVSSEVASEERPRDLSLPPGGLTSGSRDDRVAPWHLRPVRW